MHRARSFVSLRMTGTSRRDIKSQDAKKIIQIAVVEVFGVCGECILSRVQVDYIRERVGDIEGDTIIGKNHKGAMVTLDDQKKLRFAAPVKNKTAQAVTDTIMILLNQIKKYLKTITFDNGKKNSQHKNIAKELECNVYFAKPYHSWERGQNESINGLLRQYFPKSMELVNVTIELVFDAVDSLNSRPRKCLGFKTPYQAFEELTGLDMRKIMGYALVT